MMPRRPCRPGLILAVLAGLLALGAVARADAARIGLRGAFALVDADGKTVRSSDFPGQWLLLYFGYTQCTDQCPTSLSTIADALDQIGAAAQHIQPLFVTVDPARDYGAILRSFPAAFDKRIIGLTGAPAQIAKLAAMLGVKYRKVALGADDYVVDHSTTLSLIDPARRSAETFAMAESYQIAAKLIEVLSRAGVALDQVNNLGAFR